MSKIRRDYVQPDDVGRGEEYIDHLKERRRKSSRKYGTGTFKFLLRDWP